MRAGAGAAGLRGTRPSQLLFHYQSRYGTLDALTGQPATFTSYNLTPRAPGTVVGRNGVAITVGHGMPRFDQAPFRGTTLRLATEGDNVINSQNLDLVTYPLAVKLSPVSLFWRVYPMTSAGQTLAQAHYGVMLGQASTGAGWFAIRRLGTDWHAERRRGATSILSILTDIGSNYPIDVLATLSAGGTVQLQLRDANGTRVGLGVTDGTMAITSEVWGASLLGFCGAGLTAPGGRWWHEIIKVARGVKTFDQIDAMS